MKCQEAKELFPVFIDGFLSPEETQELQMHLGECQECRKDLESLQELSHILQSMPDIPIPPEFKPALHARLVEISFASKTEVIPFWQRRLAKPLTIAAVFVFLIAAASLGNILGNTNHETISIDNTNSVMSNSAMPESDMIADSGVVSNSGAAVDPGLAERKSISSDTEMAGGGVAFDAATTASDESMSAGYDQNVERKVIRNASLSLEVPEYQEAFDKISNVATQYQGYVVSGSSYTDEEGNISGGYISIRVAANSLDTALENISALGKVQSSGFSGQDVTTQYYDNEARLKQYRVQEQSLLKIMEKAKTVQDILSVETELTRVRSEIESLEGQMRYLTELTDLASIDVSLTTPAKDTQGVSLGDWSDLGSRIAAGFISSINWLINGFANLIILGGYVLPILVLILVVVFGWKRIVAVRKNKKIPPQ